MPKDDVGACWRSGDDAWPDIWRFVSRESSWFGLCDGAHISSSLDLRAVDAPASTRSQERVDHFDRDGWSIAPVVEHELAMSIGSIVATLTSGGVPAVFSYVFDEIWLPLRAILDHLRRRLGPCAALDDGWAWCVAPGDGGWSGHRGRDDVLTLVAGRPPALVNVWLALSDVSDAHSRMFVVARSADPHYPDHLDQVPDHRLATGTTAAAGEMVYWDANVYHWGSVSDSGLSGPRISCGFTIAADSFEPEAQRVGTVLGGLTDRLDAIARWIEIYGHLDRDVTPAVRQWADRWTALSRAV